jgi:hypothetical protein
MICNPKGECMNIKCAWCDMETDEPIVIRYPNGQYCEYCSEECLIEDMKTNIESSDNQNYN